MLDLVIESLRSCPEHLARNTQLVAAEQLHDDAWNRLNLYASYMERWRHQLRTTETISETIADALLVLEQAVQRAQFSQAVAVEHMRQLLPATPTAEVTAAVASNCG
jgi:hypothetical protein